MERAFFYRYFDWGANSVSPVLLRDTNQMNRRLCPDCVPCLEKPDALDWGHCRPGISSLVGQLSLYINHPGKFEKKEDIIAPRRN